MTAFRQTHSRSIRSLELALGVCASLLVGGCWGGPSVGPQLDAKGHENSAVLLTAESTHDDARHSTASAGTGADPDVADAGMGEDASAVDDSQPVGTRPKADPNVVSGDDSVRCGDGILDENEICDIGISDGKRGACVTDCGKDPCAKLMVHGCMTQCITDTSKPECAPDGK